ncbi:transporter substrate-binding domain-containing protein [Skermanella mucosa]|uniref:substrate-binding periplasmic protein n=1 Tax=Skermanella mucosa TaxID=1789672 RepID=UPI001E6435B6|nr:transporter substrate-binding domain-containing protein [Skermanella mucosa]UEM19792.1 transporter substrate-binding domain-containing protein [Skermanella mucosa]
MLQHRYTTAIPFLCFVVLLSAAADADADCLIRFGWSRGEPYAYRIYGDRLVGLDADMAGMIAEEADCQAVFFEYSPSRLPEALASGRIDAAILGDAAMPDVPTIWASASYRIEKVRLFSRTGQGVSGNNVLDLLRKGYAVAVPKALSPDQTTTLVKKDPVLRSRLREVADEAEAFSLLTTTHVEVAALGETKVVQLDGGSATARTVEPLNVTIAERRVSLALSRRTVDADLKARINKSIRSLRDREEFMSVAEIYVAAAQSRPPAD